MPDFSSTAPQIMIKDPKTQQFRLWSAKEIVDYYRDSPVVGKRTGVSGNGESFTRKLTAPLQVDANWYMRDGPGKNINPFQFDIIRNIYDNPQRFSPGQSMRVEEYAAIYANQGVTRALPQHEYLRALTPDGNFGYAYVFGETSFGLKGTINADSSGNITITDLQIKPYKDQFNIEPDKNPYGQGVFANISNKYLDSNRIAGKETPLEMEGNGAFF